MGYFSRSCQLFLRLYGELHPQVFFNYIRDYQLIKVFFTGNPGQFYKNSSNYCQNQTRISLI